MFPGPLILSMAHDPIERAIENETTTRKVTAYVQELLIQSQKKKETKNSFYAVFFCFN